MIIDKYFGEVYNIITVVNDPKSTSQIK